MTKTYSVYFETTSGRDGDSAYDNLTDATIRFEELAGADHIITVELSEMIDGEWVTLRSHTA